MADYMFASAAELGGAFAHVVAYRRRKPKKNDLNYQLFYRRLRYGERVDMEGVDAVLLEYHDSEFGCNTMEEQYLLFALDEARRPPMEVIRRMDMVYTWRKLKKKITPKFAGHIAWSLPRG